MADVSDVPDWMAGEDEASAEIAAGRVTFHADADAIFRDQDQVERWLPGDVVLAGGDGAIWRRAQADLPDPTRTWRLVGTPYYCAEDFPVRPLTLLIRNGQPYRPLLCMQVRRPIETSTAPMVCALPAGHAREVPHRDQKGTPWWESMLAKSSDPDRVCTRCGDGDLYPRRCSQCGKRWIDLACGPTHALIANELGVTPGVDEHGATVVSWGDISELVSVRAVIEKVRALLLGGCGDFEDDHTHDAYRLAKVAELLGLHVVWETCDGCGDKQIPARIQVGSDG